MAGSNQWVMGEGTDERFAWLENDDAGDVVCIERLNGDPGIAAILEAEDGNPYLTTDEQWQAIIDCIAAAPEMIAVLKSALITEFSDRGEVREFCAKVRAVLAKAEPPRKVKRKLTVFVTVEAEVDEGAHSGAVQQHALDNLHVTGVNGVVVASVVASVVKS